MLNWGRVDEGPYGAQYVYFARARPSIDVKTKGRRWIRPALCENRVGDDVDGLPLLPVEPELLSDGGSRHVDELPHLPAQSASVPAGTALPTQEAPSAWRYTKRGWLFKEFMPPRGCGIRRYGVLYPITPRQKKHLNGFANFFPPLLASSGAETE